MILAAREPRATPRRSVHLTSHCPSTAPISPSNRSLTHPAANRYPYTRLWDISAGLPEPGLEVRLRGLQSIRVKTPKPYKQTRPQPPVERGWADKADSRPPLRGPGGWGGDWYLWHAPDGPRARAATGLGCVQAGTEKSGVMEASYASAIIGVLSPVSSHCLFCHLSYASSGRRLAAALDAGSPSRPWIGFVFAPPDRWILIQPSEVTRFASIPNWLCFALF